MKKRIQFFAGLRPVAAAKQENATMQGLTPFRADPFCFSGS
jgi:hypothetical protein